MGDELVAKPVFTETDKKGLMAMSSGMTISKEKFFVTGDDVDKVLESIKDEVSSYVLDISTAKGRAAVTKTVSIITASKTYLEAQGKDLSAEYKLIPGKIDKNRAKVKEYLTQLQADIRKPLTDWQDEQAKIKAEKEAKEAEEKLLAEFNVDHEMAELMDDKFNRDAADEARRLAKEKTENDERLAREGEAAKTLAAEKLAKKLIDDKEAEKQRAISDKAKAESDLLESQAKESALKKQAEQDKIKAEWLAVEVGAYQINYDIDAKAWQAQQAAEAETKRLADIEAAKQKQIALQQAEDQRIKDEKAKREADIEHNRAVNKGIVAEFTAVGLSYDDAVKAVTVMVKGIRNVTINY